LLVRKLKVKSLNTSKKQKLKKINLMHKNAIKVKNVIEITIAKHVYCSYIRLKCSNQINIICK